MEEQNMSRRQKTTFIVLTIASVAFVIYGLALAIINELNV